MDQTIIRVTDLFLPGGEAQRREHLHRLISSYLTGGNPSIGSTAEGTGSLPRSDAATKARIATVASLPRADAPVSARGGKE